MKILTVVGARPQFIKASVVSAEILKRGGVLKEILVHTGQHFDHRMSEVFFQQMKMRKPDHHLNVNCLSHGAMTGLMMMQLEEVMLAELPDLVLVYGDTNSTLAGALTAVKSNIPVAHVEAGLRSYDWSMPEEINRILTDRISTHLFCPTQTAIRNLSKEGFDQYPCHTLYVGDVMLDAALLYAPASVPPDAILPEKFALATLHRQGNTINVDVLSGIAGGLRLVAATVPLVIPLHPGTRKLMEKAGVSLAHPNIYVIEPVGYLESLWLLQHCIMVLTDSGGLQKEAAFFRKPCVTLRNETEWVELVETGANMLSGSIPERILETFRLMQHRVVDPQTDLFGGGQASSRIIDHFENQY